MKETVAVALTYIVVALFTYGWTYHRSCEPPSGALPGATDACALGKAMAWPIYWSLKFSREGLAPAGAL